MRQRLPEWLKRGIINTENTRLVRNTLRDYGLNTVCDSARCPNKGECYSKNTATFMILGNTCTRNCRFCSVNSGNPEPVNPDEPEMIKQAVAKLGLKYVVITSVTRDDLPDGGAEHFAGTIRAIRSLGQDIKIEVLTPDFQGNKGCIDIVIDARPDVFNHNIETVHNLYDKVRPQADYIRSLEFLAYIKEKCPDILTKTGLMAGLGETEKELIMTFNDLKVVNCDILTIGQYIQPTKDHLAVEKYLTPEEFVRLRQIAQEIGINHVFSAPLVRSSYNAREVFSGGKILS